jgi:hypothetical protein
MKSLINVECLNVLKYEDYMWMEVFMKNGKKPKKPFKLTLFDLENKFGHHDATNKMHMWRRDPKV